MRLFAFLFFLGCFSSNFGQNARIILDGKFADWDDVPLAYTDAPGDEGSSDIDFGKLWITNDEDYLFLKLEVGEVINLQSDNQVTIYLDTDNNSSTGINFNGIGAEITYNIGVHDGTARLNGFNYSLDHEDIGLVTAPTVTSDVFEIAIRRNGQINGNATFTSNTIKVGFRDEGFGGDWLPASGGSVTYTMVNQNLEPLPSYSISKVGGNQTFRAISYNVLQDGLFDSGRQPAFRRIFQALQPEIIGIQEVYDYGAASVENLIESFLPSSSGEEWYSAKVNPDIICVSRHKIKQAFIIDGVGSGANGAFLIELPAPFNSDLLFIVAHTPCCDNDNGRQLEIDAMMSFIRDAKSGNGFPELEDDTPIIISGDMNLVGDNQQLNSLLFGDIVNENIYGGDFNPDWDGTALDDVLPISTNTPMAFTWATNFSSFSPGRLDFIIYTGSVLEVKNSFNLFTPTLTTNELSQYNLINSDSPIASDHLAMVADFGRKSPVSTTNFKPENGFAIKKIYPNPTPGKVSVEYTFDQILDLRFIVFDVNGRRMFEKATPHYQIGQQVIELDLSPQDSGLYNVVVESLQGDRFGVFMVQKQ
jgi:hypothetical protein